MSTKIEKCYSFVLRELKKYLEDAAVSDVVVGLSGGIDSALVATIAADALGREHVHTVMMPSPYTSIASIQDASEIAENLGVKHSVIRIDELMGSFKDALLECITWEAEDITEQNLQSRIRAVILMGISNKTNSILLATSNKSEILTGYFTLYGDSCGGYAPISSFFKTQVYELAHWRNNNVPKAGLLNKRNILPESVLRKTPTAELKHNQKDSDTLPEYKILDEILTAVLSKQDLATLNIEKQTILNVVDRIKQMEYKRKYLSPGPDLAKVEE